MLFLTLLFVFFYGYALAKGRLFYDLQIELLEFQIKKEKGQVDKVSNELGLKALLLVVYMVAIILFLAIYLVKATGSDPLLYPTLGVIILNFLSLVVGSAFNKKRDLSDEKQAIRALVKQQDRYTFKGVAFNLIYLTYFIYMFLVLVEII